MTIIVTGQIDLDPAKRDEFIASAATCMAATRAEDGNEGYAFSADLEDPGRFYVAEHWATQDAITTHMGTAHLAAFMGSMGGFGVTFVTLTQWDGATPTKLM
jgi:quinol monooxygenase YgiN